jgi:Rap1a immunity proteins
MEQSWITTRFFAGPVAAALIALLTTPAGALAQANELPPTTATLYQDCSSNDPARQLSCDSYIAGVADMMRLIGSGIEKGRVSEAARADFAAFGICHDYTGTELRNVFMEWAAKNPGELNGYRLFGVRRAFRKAWRCH